MFSKLYNSAPATIFSIAGYPLIFYIIESLKYYLKGVGGGEVITFITVIFVIPYYIIIAIIAFCAFLFQRFKNQQLSFDKNEWSILNKFLFLTGLIIFFSVFLFVFLGFFFLL